MRLRHIPFLVFIGLLVWITIRSWEAALPFYTLTTGTFAVVWLAIFIGLRLPFLAPLRGRVAMHSNPSRHCSDFSFS